MVHMLSMISITTSRRSQHCNYNYTSRQDHRDGPNISHMRFWWFFFSRAAWILCASIEFGDEMLHRPLPRIAHARVLVQSIVAPFEW